MGDERQSSVEGMGDILESIRKHYPGAIEKVASTLKPTALAQLEADKAVADPYAGLNQELFAKYGPEAAKTNAEIQSIADTAASSRELGLAQGTGRELVTEADRAQRQLDPEFYKQREDTSAAMAKYLNLANPELTEADREEIRRGTGRTLTNPNSAMDTAINAGRFGSKFDEKKTAFGDAISRVTAALPNLRSGISGFEVATRRALTPTGSDRVQNVIPGAGSSTYDLANNWISQAGGLQGEAMRRQKSLLENVTGWGEFGGKVVGAAAGAIGCWVAREVFGTKDVTWRIFRLYLALKAPSWFRWLYITFGERFARFIANKPKTKRFIKRLMLNKLKEVGYAI